MKRESLIKGFVITVTVLIIGVISFAAIYSITQSTDKQLQKAVETIQMSK